MLISDYIAQNLVDPEKHARILNALIAILEEEGERGPEGPDCPMD